MPHVIAEQIWYFKGGGNVESIKFLLERGADPNKIGQFLRTPLYRAAFAGHLEACEVYNTLYYGLNGYTFKSSNSSIFDAIFNEGKLVKNLLQ